MVITLRLLTMPPMYGTGLPSSGVSLVYAMSGSQDIARVGLSPWLLRRGGADICGLILLAAAGRPLGEVLRSQLHAMPAAQTVLPQIDGAIDALAAGRHVNVQTLHPGLR
ncbi:hypothetical protein AA12467_0871 [Gluconobacter sphaericus NBRC 12467]|nr:hypothetical protein AA12467_0871 [Gluconobacter sphaericus NBRC 12467]